MNVSKTSIIPLTTLLLSLFISACGGGGGGVTTPNQPTTAVLTFSTVITGSIPAGATINGYRIGVTLPAGVSVKASPDPGEPAVLVTDSGIVTATGAAAGAVIVGVYSAATATLPGEVVITVASGSGISAGEFGALTCDIASGYYPAASDFLQPAFSASGVDTTTNSTVDLTGQMSLSVSAAIN